MWTHRKDDAFAFRLFAMIPTGMERREERKRKRKRLGQWVRVDAMEEEEKKKKKTRTHRPVLDNKKNRFHYC